MIKQEIVSMVKNLLPKYDKAGLFHDRFLEAVIEDVLREMYSDLYKINPLLLDNFTKTYEGTSKITVSFDSETGLYYSTLPALINLPCKTSGVRHIYTVNQAGNTFHPMDAREADLVFNTDVAVVTDKIGFRVRQDNRVDYYNMSSAVWTDGVRMDILIPFSVYLESDVVAIPELGEKEGGDFVSRVMKKLQVIAPVDLKDDNASKTEQANAK